MNNESQDTLLTVLEMAKMLKISRSKAYELIKEKSFPIIKIGKCIRISQKELINYLHNYEMVL